LTFLLLEDEIFLDILPAGRRIILASNESAGNNPSVTLRVPTPLSGGAFWDAAPQKPPWNGQKFTP